MVRNKARGGRALRSMVGMAALVLMMAGYTSVALGSTVTYTWKFDRFAVGINATGSAQDSSRNVMMSDIIKLPDGSYRMYYGASLSPTVSGATTAIKSATSTDGINWAVESGYRLLGDGDGDTGPDGIPANEGVISGPRLVRLSNGTYRMYYQASTSGTSPPDFRVKSAISSDGMNWTREGTRVDINYPNGGANQFSLAGHSYVIRFADNDYVILLSGNYNGKTVMQPSDLVFGTSNDGLTFSNFSVLYTNGHDPFVVKLADGSGYRLFYGNLLERQRTAFSSDGKNWPSVNLTTETILLNSTDNEVTEASTESPGDRGALELSSGEIILFVNWGNPSTNIALMRQKSTSTISSCTTISSPGTYVLTQNIINSTGSTCINITSSDVTFDGAGYTIDGINAFYTYGVHVYNQTTALINVTVKNLVVKDWEEGVYYQKAANSSIVNNTAYSNIRGITLGISSNNNLTSNTASFNSYGISLGYSSNNNNLTSNTASSNSNYGIYLLYSSNNNNLTNNTASSNSNYGIYLFSSGNNNLTSNTASSNSVVGIYLHNGSNNTLISNTASSNIIGIALWNSSNNRIYNNRFNNTNNFDFAGTYGSYWNVTKTPSTNIIGGPYLGGNFWAYPNGTGYSKTCADSNSDGICDSSYTLDSNNIDYLPLAYKFTSTPTANVSISGLSFQPQTINVSAGTTVTWTNLDSVTHTVTSDTGLFDSGFLSTGQTFSRTFNAAGNYDYHCSIHSFMTGRVAVSAPSLVFAITPNSRNAQVGTPVTIFMSVINGGTATATGVSIAQASGLPVTVSYQQWNGTAFTGSANTPVNIAAGSTANFVLTINATSVFSSSSLTFNVSGTNAAQAPISGVNTLTISASSVPSADIIMMATGTLDYRTGVGNSTAFAVATSNVGTATATGVSFNIVVPSSITGLVTQVNETYPTNGTIKGPATGLSIAVGGTPTFAVFLTPTAAIANDPANNRITLRLVDGSGKIIGAQSVAVSTT